MFSVRFFCHFGPEKAFVFLVCSIVTGCSTHFSLINNPSASKLTPGRLHGFWSGGPFNFNESGLINRFTSLIEFICGRIQLRPFTMEPNFFELNVSLDQVSGLDAGAFSSLFPVEEELASGGRSPPRDPGSRRDGETRPPRGGRGDGVKALMRLLAASMKFLSGLTFVFCWVWVLGTGSSHRQIPASILPDRQNGTQSLVFQSPQDRYLKDPGKLTFVQIEG